jgi:hypothetical protein
MFDENVVLRRRVVPVNYKSLKKGNVLLRLLTLSEPIQPVSKYPGIPLTHLLI